ncbi:hypothetical protein PTTG_27363 [Puccinia triticina 1-1 BBBD Race 1]|uniref:Uncharacterized protein n=2 Tax=Puccinia triticina TaxID=208348 RepID=A0A180GKT2_PUCT1|nr:uncharacterized protein PtA15_13A78 [Puccinia triticina]OAV93290.1 hypothetical protein PTTG_27363 [Puccinia triticina 1-1 BBBD Race 1]WAQ90679.1 hypothetical protein PtA15_13A78 [Puccinia triticina]WAR60834.1 hypothetical protein PtB15_13B80 [Puccinia triticina]
MRFHAPLHAHRPVSHPIFGPTIHRPTHMIPTVFQTKQPIPSKLIPADQIKLPPSSSSSTIPPKKLAKTKISTKIIRGILDSVQNEVSASRRPNQSILASPIWPQNLRVEDDWKGRGKWGESRPDHLEWLGVQKKHKDLMLSLRAER